MAWSRLRLILVNLVVEQSHVTVLLSTPGVARDAVLDPLLSVGVSQIIETHFENSVCVAVEETEHCLSIETRSFFCLELGAGWRKSIHSSHRDGES